MCTRKSPVLFVFCQRRHIASIMYPCATAAARRRCRRLHLYYHYFSARRRSRRGAAVLRSSPAKARKGHSVAQKLANNICRSGSQATRHPPTPPNHHCALFSFQVRPRLLSSARAISPSSPPILFPSSFSLPPPVPPSQPPRGTIFHWDC